MTERDLERFLADWFDRHGCEIGHPAYIRSIAGEPVATTDRATPLIDVTGPGGSCVAIRLGELARDLLEELR